MYYIFFDQHLLSIYIMLYSNITMHLLDQPTKDKYSIYVSMYPAQPSMSKHETDEKYSTMNKWLHKRLKVHRDYHWDIVKFTLYSKGGSTSYPTGISFTNTADALAFKLAFGL